MSKNPYEILEVEQTATATEIKSAYRRLANKYHPDKNKEPGAEGKFKEIASAYEIIGKQESRDKYDSENRPRTNPGSGRHEFHEDMFNDFFKGEGFNRYNGFRWGESTPRKGADQNIFVYLTLEEIFTGCEKEVTTSTGRKKVNLKPGMGAGTKLKLHGNGDESDNGGTRGDAILNIRELVHDVFTKEGNNLLYTVFVGFCDMMLGCKIQIPYIKGEVKITVPPLTEDGTTLTFKGKGFKDGDMVVTVKIYYPKTLSTNERKMLDELSKSANMKNMSVKPENRN